MGKFGTMMFTNLMKIERFEIYVMRLMIHDEDSHYFTIAHYTRTVSAMLTRLV
ncbi:hypothetical protein [Prevotella sp. S7 MS 2]|uniref:hypothetical protein n=1 Tax=Prevotella sp. S7 MS 2 TaxID=1287488 RepID=UPI0012EC7AF9|nr:hypothetical protein [Prevotella sp. S7 MS 2]